VASRGMMRPRFCSLQFFVPWGRLPGTFVML
jgi:hypothetical protein